MKDSESGSRSTCSGVNVNSRHEYLCVLSAVSWRCCSRKFNECFILDTPFVFEFPFLAG